MSKYLTQILPCYYIIFNSLFISPILLTMKASDRSAPTDQEMVEYGVTNYVGPALLLAAFGIFYIPPLLHRRIGSARSQGWSQAE